MFDFMAVSNILDDEHDHDHELDPDVKRPLKKQKQKQKQQQQQKQKQKQQQKQKQKQKQGKGKAKGEAWRVLFFHAVDGRELRYPVVRSSVCGAAQSLSRDQRWKSVTYIQIGFL